MRQDLALGEADESLLVGADLMDIDVIEAGLGVFVDPRQVLSGVGTDDDALLDLFRRDKLHGLLEVRRSWQLLA
jgi:hypothetical protein